MGSPRGAQNRFLVHYRLSNFKKNRQSLSALARWRNQAAKLLSGRFYRPDVRTSVLNDNVVPLQFQFALSAVSIETMSNKHARVKCSLGVPRYQRYGFDFATLYPLPTPHQLKIKLLIK